MPPGRLLIIALTAVIAMSFVPALVKATSANEATIGIARLAIAVLAFMPVVLWQGKLKTLSLRQWRELAIIGAVFGVHWLTYFISIKLSSPAVAALAVTTYGVQYLVLAWWFNGESIAPFEWLGVACCFTGCIIVSPALSLDDDTTVGLAVGLFSALLYAALPLLHQRARDIGTTERSWGQFFFALLVFMPLWFQSDWQLRHVDWYQLLVLGVVCTVFAHGLWVKVSTELPALYTSMIYYLYLPLAMIYSAVFLEEAMTAQKLMGATLVISSSVGLSLYRYRRMAAIQQNA